MLDIKFIREHAEVVKKAAKDKNPHGNGHTLTDTMKIFYTDTLHTKQTRA